MSAAENLAASLTDRQVRLLAQVASALSGGETPVLSFEEWCEAELLLEEIEAEALA